MKEHNATNNHSQRVKLNSHQASESNTQLAGNSKAVGHGEHPGSVQSVTPRWRETTDQMSSVLREVNSMKTEIKRRGTLQTKNKLDASV